LVPQAPWVDKFYELYSAPYLPTSEPARLRVEQGLPKILKHLPEKGSEVLDLCCGGGLYLFGLEKAGYKMTGVDMEPRMLKAARKHAKETGSKARIVKGDATNLRFKGRSFGAVVFMGAATGHFSMAEVKKIMGGVHTVLRPKGVVITEVNDHIALFLSGMYQRILYEPSGENDVISIHTRYDGEKGTFNRLFLNLESDKKFKAPFQIWAPWILNSIMDDAGFDQKSSETGAFGGFSRILVHAKR